MFILKDEISYWWPVTVRMPNATGSGDFTRQTFKALFEALTRDEAEALDKEVMAALNAGDETKRDALLERVVKDWEGVVDEDKGEIAFSAETLRQALQWPWVRVGLYDAWTQSQSGEKRRLGN